MTPQKQVNDLVFGEIGTVGQRNPQDQKYPRALEYAEGVDIIGGVTMHSAAEGELEDFQVYNDYLPDPDNHYYYRNTDAGLSTPNQALSSLASDFAAVAVTSVNDRLTSFLQAGTFLAKNGAGDQVGAYNAYTVSSAGNRFWQASNTNVYRVTGTIRYVRAYAWTNPATNQKEWGILCRKKVYDKERYYAYTSDLKVLGPVAGSVVTVFGRGEVHASSATSVSNPQVTAFGYTGWTDSIVDIEPIVYEWAAGDYTNIANDCWIVGVYRGQSSTGAKSMFTGSPKISKYKHTAQPLSGNAFATSASVTTDSSSQTQPKIKKVDDTIYVLYYGAAGAEVISGNPSTSDASDTLGTLDTGVSGLDSANVPVKTSATDATKRFYFKNTKTIVANGRRFGAGIVSLTGTGPADGDKIYLCATKAGSTSGGSTMTLGSTPAAGDPYALRLDGEPLWIEKAYQGLYVGTRKSEWLLTNYSYYPGGNPGVTATQISSVGSSWDGDNLRALSTVLNGTVWFCSPRGIARLTFSNEAQTYTPVQIDLVAMGYGTPQSISSSKKFGYLYVEIGTTQDEVSGTALVLQINPETGAISRRLMPRKTVSSVSYYFNGMDTVNGEPRFHYGAQGYPISTMKQCGLTNSLSRSFLRTTKFGVFPDSRAVEKKVWLNMVNTSGGRVRMANKQSADWVEIPYTANELSNGLFTGVKEVYLNDAADSQSEGKAIEIDFSSDEPFNLVSVTMYTEG